MNQPIDIAEQIIKVVKMCHEKGVNTVYVSSIPLRKGKEQEVNDVNNFLRANTFMHDFILIDNSNITLSHIYRDNVHLNFNGTRIIANNFIRAINGKRAG